MDKNKLKEQVHLAIENKISGSDEYGCYEVNISGVDEAVIAVLDILQKHLAGLQLYKASTSGLWCIDREPKDVDYKWIIENSFQLKESK